VGNDVQFRPSIFTRPESLKKRIDYLKRKRYPIIGLEEGIRLLSQNRLPPCATVITIDDGWYGIKLNAHDLLNDQKIPYTIYVTSYYAENETPIFGLVIQYIFWKTRVKNWDQMILDLTKEMTIPTISNSSKADQIEEIIEFGEKNLDSDGRKQLMERLAKSFGVDYTELSQRRIFNLLNRSEIRELSSAGANIQLHTHRHVWPLDLVSAKQEIELNRSFLEPLVESKLEHFCYPNGTWQEEQLQFFDGLDIKSATTCDPGLNYSDTHRLALKRYVDSEKKSKIEFEAEMSGFSEILHRVLSVLSFSRNN